MRKVLLLLCVAIVAFAQIPEVMTYQGKLTDADGIGIEGSFDITFRLFDVATGGTALWTESHTGLDQVVIEHGLFNTELGAITTFGVLDFGIQYYLEIEIDGDVMTPRQPLRTDAYAMRAKVAGELEGGISLETVLVEGNSTGGIPITDATDDVVDIADGLRLTDGNTLSVDNIEAEGTDDNINLMDDLDLNGNMIFNSNAGGYGGRVAFNDNIVPVSSAQDLGHADYRWDDIFLGGTSVIDINGDAGTAGEVLTIDGCGNLSWATGGTGGADNDWTMIGTDMYNTALGNVSIGQSVAPAAANRLAVSPHQALKAGWVLPTTEPTDSLTPTTTAHWEPAESVSTLLVTPMQAASQVMYTSQDQSMIQTKNQVLLVRCSQPLQQVQTGQHFPPAAPASGQITLPSLISTPLQMLMSRFSTTPKQMESSCKRARWKQPYTVSPAGAAGCTAILAMAEL